MRQTMKRQSTIFEEPQVDHPRAEEFTKMGMILDANPLIYELVHADLTRTVKNEHSGSKGMSAEQVTKAAIIRQTEEFSYEELAFHLLDSKTYRNFCSLGITDKSFGKSCLCNNIKAISAETWAAINRILIGYADNAGIEKGRKTRIDCTVVSSNIHAPSDSSLLWDCVRVLTRLLDRFAERFSGLEISYCNRIRRAKRRMLGVMNARNQKIRKRQYIDLIKVTEETVGYAQNAEINLAQAMLRDSYLEDVIAGPIQELRHYLCLTHKVIDQTKRRVVRGESVPSQEKIVSIFESHTDIIVKDRRDTYYGHKICLTGGESNLIIDCDILDGNPADATLVGRMCDRQNEIYGRYPLKVALDGGFASRDNLKEAKSRNIRDVCFSKGRGLTADNMCKSTWVYKQMRRFRAGIESGISWLKRCFGLGVCLWKSHRSFKSYVWASIVSGNLVTLARHKLA